MCQIPSNRRLVCLADLHYMIDLEIDEQIQAQNEFTAYSITLELRRKNPTLEIVHHEVRAWVHQQMAKLCGISAYRSEIRLYPKGDALTYIPVKVKRRGSKSKLFPRIHWEDVPTV